MDNPTASVAERPSGGPGLLSNGPSFRRSMRPTSNSVVGDNSVIGPPINVATFVVHKDDNGYGMKVSGDNPVYVQSVKEGGAAEKAGLHSGDKIIKVNGENVTQSTHTEVVALIKSATQVVLTVQQRPAPSAPMPRPVSAAMTSPSLHARPLTHHHSAPARDRVTSPQPVDHEKLRQLECQRVRTLQLMLEKEQRYVEALRSEIAKSNDTKFVQELVGAERRVRTLQDQLLTLQAAQQPGAEYCTSPSEPGNTPPPLPCRNRPLVSTNLDVPPPLPPRPLSLFPTPVEGDESAHATNNDHAGNAQVSSLHSHHRTKSSPDPLNAHNMSLAEASKRLIASESMSDLNAGTKRSRGVSWDVDSPRVTPPGTPPPPYGGANSSADGADHTELDGSGAHDELHNVSEEPVSPLRTQSLIISMEDEDMSDQEMNQMEDHGPFKSLSKLWEHNAHLAVFMNYVISNSDPSSLLFYLVTDLYKEGNAKEMKKWAYEIHSSFLVPGAPLRLNNVDENVAREIDDVLLKEADKEEILRKIFWKARTKAKEELNEQLADFQQKRTAGLGTIFGPGDDKLDESIHDKNKELKIVETILMPKIEPYLEDIERDLVDIRRFTLGAALGTVLVKVFGLRGPHSNALLDRCPTFVSKDKSLKARFIGKSRKMTVRGHHFVAHQYFTVTYCNHCQLIIWGIGPQGYQCSNCVMNIHRHCVRVVEESCPGPINKKEKGNDRISKLMEKIRPERDPRRKPSSLNLVQLDRGKKPPEDGNDLGDGEAGDRPVSGGRGGSVGAGDRRPDPVREGDERCSQDGLHDEDNDHHHEITHHVPKKLASNSINRSESYKERVHAKRQLRERRKTSDPNLSKTNDVDLDSQGLLSNTNSGSSSNSSLSTRSLDSPSNSLEIVTNSRTQEALTVTLTPNSSGTLWDSDLESEPDPPDWSRGVEEEVLKQLSAREKKRQEVINELFHTERSHVRNLKVLDQVFHRPMLEREVLPADQIQLLFSNLDTMLDIHSQFNNGMKCKRRENPLVGDLSDLLLSMFDGPAGDSFQHAAATFCARQQIALESLKERRRKDAKLHNFLTDAEVNPMCRRLQLKDIIPTALQRLTKYPLLFENLAKYTSSSEEEEALIKRAVERSKEILNHVNHAVREAEDNQRLADIQRRLDKSAFDKVVDHPMVGEYKTLDLTKHRLVYEGSLTWRIGNRTKLIDLHVVLLEDVIILLQKQDEKFIMKFLSISAAGGGSSPQLSPIIKVSTVLVRPNAVDKKALYLVNTSQNAAQIFDLVATSSSERKIWFRHISEAAEAYKTRDGKNRGRVEPSASSQPLSGAPTTDIDSPDVVQEKTKETEENEVKPANESSLLVGSDLDASHNSTGSEDVTATADSTTGDSSTPQASPDSTDAVTKKLGDGAQPVAAVRSRVEPLRLLTEESPLIEPSEVVVSQRSVLKAEPVLTPIERLRRQDEAIRVALNEKQQLVADILHVPREEFETIAELAAEPNADKDATELVLAAVNQANQLSSVLNDTLQVTVESAMTATSERTNQKTSRLPGVPTYKLQTISDALNSQLTELLKIIKQRDDEREQLRRELQKHREQIHAMHESRHRNHVTTADSSAASQSRTTDQASEDDTGLPRCEPPDDRLVVPPTPGTSVDLHEDLGTTDEFVDALTSVDAESCCEPCADSNGFVQGQPTDEPSNLHPTECQESCPEATEELAVASD